MKAIGIDIGTTSICLVVYEAAGGKIIDSVSADHYFLGDTFCQDPDGIVKTAVELLQTILAAWHDVDVIGVSSQMHGILYVDSEGNAVSPFYTWKDKRGNEMIPGGSYASVLSEKMNQPLYTGYGTVTHSYFCQNKQIPKKAVCLAGIGDYLVMKLCGRKTPLMGATIAASLGGFSLEKMEFDIEKLQAAGVETDYYPQVTKAAAEAGRYKGIPVYSAIGDNQASFYGAVLEDESYIGINVGTGSQVSFYDTRYVALQTGEIRPYTENGYLYVQASVNGGKVYEKLASFMEEIILGFTGTRTDRTAVYAMMETIGQERAETDLTINPSLYGSRAGSFSAGSMKGLTESNFHPADVIRAYVAGMAKELYDLYHQFPQELKAGRTKIAVSGNGIRKNALLQQEIEKIFGLPLVVRDISEEAAAGAAMMVLRR